MINQELFDWQKRALRAIEIHKSLYFNCEVGTGKTFAAVKCVEKLMAEKEIKRVLIVTLSGVIPGWMDEFSKTQIDQSKIKILTGSGDNRLKLIHQGEILITNHESLNMSHVVKGLMRFGADLLIIDEAHKEKTHNSKRTKAAIKLADQIERKILMSGTRVLNSLMDTWSQYRILDGGERLGARFSSFRDKFFFDLNAHWSNRPNYFPKYVPRPESYEAISDLIKDITITVKQEEFLKLPPLISKKYFVELTKDQRRIYSEMQNDLVAFLSSNSGDPIIAQQAIVKAAKLQQITSGFIKDANNNTHAVGFPQKLIALEEILKEHSKDHKIIVWARFKFDFLQIRHLCQKLNIGAVEYHGEVKQELRETAVKAFQTNNQTRILIANPQSAGTGLNLQVSDMSVFYSRGFNLEHELQAIGRNRRSGSEIHERIIKFDIVAKDTLDELIIQALVDKKKIDEELIKFSLRNIVKAS